MHFSNIIKLQFEKKNNITSVLEGTCSVFSAVPDNNNKKNVIFY